MYNVAMLSLTVLRRDKKESLDKIRKNGNIPAVFYGPKEVSTSVIISMSEFKKVWKKAGESSVILLKDKEHEHETLIYDIDVHPVTGVPRHVDFYVIEKGKKVKVHIPLVFNGVSSAVKDKGAILVKVIRELEIEASPKDLPHELVVDISPLIEFTSVILVKDIKLPQGVSLVTGSLDIVASISEAKEEEEEVKPVDMSAIEVEKKGKEAKEGEEIVEDNKADSPDKDSKKGEKK